MHGWNHRPSRQFVALFLAADSSCLDELPIGASPCGARRRLLLGSAPGGCVPADTISRSVARAHQPRARLQPAFSRDGTPDRSNLSRIGLAFRDLIMDDKSMQSWSTMELTLIHAPGKIPGMDKPNGRPRKQLTPSAYEEAFRRRVRAARALYTEEPKEMARALGVREDTYYRYETRTMLPHYLMQRFCDITGVTIDWLVTGPKPGQPSHTGITIRE